MSADEMAKLLDEIGQRLGPSGQYVFGLAVRQVYIDSFLGLAVGALLLVGAWASYRRVRAHVASEWARWNALPNSEKQYPYLNGKPDALGGALGWYAFVVVLTMIGLFFATFSISGILNPEYAAIRDILSALVPR